MKSIDYKEGPGGTEDPSAESEENIDLGDHKRGLSQTKGKAKLLFSAELTYEFVKRIEAVRKARINFLYGRLSEIQKNIDLRV